MGLSKEQLQLLKTELQQLDDGSGFVPAGSVNTAFVRSGLSTSDQDEALLYLRVDADSGRVSYQRLLDEITAREPNSPAAETTTGTIAQQELVFKVMSDIRDLFYRFDIGALSLQGFRHGLERLGLRETPAMQDLYRHKYQMTFNQLIQALTRVEDHSVGARAATPSKLTNEPSPQTRYLPRGRGLFDEERRNESQVLSATRDYDPNSARRQVDFENQRINTPTDGSRVRKDVLRQQIHAAVRRMDAGELDTRAFARKLDEWGVEITEETHRLLDRTSMGVPVPFKDWVRLFDEQLRKQYKDEEHEEELETLNMSNVHEQEAQARATTERRARGHYYGPPSNGNILVAGEYAPSSSINPESARSARKTFARESFEHPYLLVPELAEPEPDRSSERRGLRMIPRDRTQPKDFLCWSERDYREPPPSDLIPMRGGGLRRNEEAPPFAREGDAIPQISFGGLDRSPHKNDRNRTPFGTERDVGASFANGVAPTGRPLTFG